MLTALTHEIKWYRRKIYVYMIVREICDATYKLNSCYTITRPVTYKDQTYLMQIKLLFEKEEYCKPKRVLTDSVHLYIIHTFI